MLPGDSLQDVSSQTPAVVPLIPGAHSLPRCCRRTKVVGLVLGYWEQAQLTTTLSGLPLYWVFQLYATAGLLCE